MFLFYQPVVLHSSRRNKSTLTATLLKKKKKLDEDKDMLCGLKLQYIMKFHIIQCLDWP